MSKLSSVEWLQQQLLNAEPNLLEWQKYLLQAKEMHKQEIIDAYATVITKYNGVKSWTKIYDDEAEQYYNETYLTNQVKTDK